MTALRREAFLWAVVLAVATAPMLAAGPGRAGTSEQIVADPNSGLAINGYDPVDYFLEGKPVSGKANFEYDFGGAVWRFRNEGNRAAFAADPAVYAPQFGGYDPVGVARGVPLAGDPRLWLVQDRRLYLFYSEDNRAAFSQDPDQVVRDSRRTWPTLRNTLSP